jgi:hypothetical protein
MSVTGIVFFKFKHQNLFDKIEFPASEITVAELKIKISEKLQMNEGPHAYKNSSLEISRYTTAGAPSQVFEYDHELVPSHTSVLVMRVPAGRAAGKRMIVEASDLFANPISGQEDPLALKQSIIQEEIDAKRVVPKIVVCELCQWLMDKAEKRGPVTLACCGHCVCATCASKTGITCPIEKIDFENPVKYCTNRAIERLVEVVSKNKETFLFEGVHTGETFFIVPEPALHAHAQEIDVVDVDLFEPEVVDVDNPRPLTAKEKEQLERREKRKQKAMEILMKREGKAVKGELTEADVNKLLKQELKAETSEGLGIGGHLLNPDEESKTSRQIIVEFPKLLSREEFSKWQKSAHST